MVVIVQDHRYGDVDSQADQGNDQHGPSQHVLGMLQTYPDFTKDAEAYQHQCGAVGKRSQDLQSMETIGVAIIGGRADMRRAA